MTDPSHLNTSTAFLHHLRTQNTLQQRYQSTDQNDASRPIWRPGNRTGDTFASATPPQNYFSSSNLGHELEGAQEDAYGTGIRRIPNHRRHPGHGVSSPASPQATSGTNDGTSFEELFFRMHAPPSSIQPRPLTSQQSFEREAAHRAAALRQYREIDEFHIRQVRFMQEQRERDQRPAPSLDNDTTRPEPLSEDAKMVKMECKICFGQVSNHVVLPCGKSRLGFHLEREMELADKSHIGHCCLCKWCCDQLFPRATGDRTRPADRAAVCPMCRRKVKTIVRPRP